jgi:hypothetical protein
VWVVSILLLSHIGVTRDSALVLTVAVAIIFSNRCSSCEISVLMRSAGHLVLADNEQSTEGFWAEKAFRFNKRETHCAAPWL